METCGGSSFPLGIFRGTMLKTGALSWQLLLMKEITEAVNVNVQISHCWASVQAPLRHAVRHLSSLQGWSCMATRLGPNSQPGIFSWEQGTLLPDLAQVYC